MLSSKPKDLRNFVIKSTHTESRSFHSFGRAKKKPPSLGSDSLSIKEKSLPQKYKNTWIIKEAEDLSVAYNEVIAQEFFRFFIPGQPKTRLVLDGKKAGILSKEIPHYQCLEDLESKVINTHIKNGTYTGLGEILVIALLVNEIDLRFPNLGVDAKGQIIKIDGDWCFASHRSGFEKTNYTITEDILSRLPFPGTYAAHNWMDAILNSVSQTTTTILDADISLAPHFRAEVNRALLKVCVMPEEFFTAFVRSYVSEEKEIDRLRTEIRKRAGELKAAALANKSFQEFLKTPTAETELTTHIEYLKTFKTTEKNFILRANPRIEENMRANFAAMCSSVSLSSAPTATSSTPTAAPVRVESKLREEVKVEVIKPKLVSATATKEEVKVEVIKPKLVSATLPATEEKKIDRLDSLTIPIHGIATTTLNTAITKVTATSVTNESPLDWSPFDRSPTNLNLDGLLTRNLEEKKVDPLYPLTLSPIDVINTATAALDTATAEMTATPIVNESPSDMSEVNLNLDGFVTISY